MKKSNSNWDEKYPVFFKKHQEEKYIYYPWAYPSEGFYIDKKQKWQIELFMCLVVALLAAAIFTIMFLNLQSIYILNYLINATSIVISILYIWGIRLFIKNLSSCSSPIEKSKKGSLLPLIYIVGFQLLGIYMVLTDNSLSSFTAAALIALSLGFSFYISYVLLTVYKTKGYFFTKKQ